MTRLRLVLKKALESTTATLQVLVCRYNCEMVLLLTILFMVQTDEFLSAFQALTRDNPTVRVWLCVKRARNIASDF